VTTHQRGLFYGAAAYALWGVFPLYFTLLEPTPPTEILAYRIVWSLVVVGIATAVLHRWTSLVAIRRQQAAMLTAAAVALSVNWLTFVYAVGSGQVVESSLGYFINPLVTVLLGVLVLREHVNRTQKTALLIAGAAVVLLTANYGRVPWIALTLAFSFGGYGLLKKQAGMGALESLTFETAVLLIPALGYLLFLTSAGDQTFLGRGAGHALLLVGHGTVAALRGRSHTDPADITGPVAVHRSRAAVPHRRGRARRVDALGPLGGFRVGVGRVDHHHRRYRWPGPQLDGQRVTGTHPRRYWARERLRPPAPERTGPDTMNGRVAPLRASQVILPVVALAAVMWALEIIDWVLPGTPLDYYGVESRSTDGLVGVVAAPFLHQGFDHLIANTIPFLVLGILVSWRSQRKFWAVFALIVIGSGLGVWLIGPDFAITIGASGVVFGFLGYLLTAGIITRRWIDVLIACAVLLTYGSLLSGTLPFGVANGVSWQMHLTGALSGVLSAVLFAGQGDDNGVRSGAGTAG
jgi:chloramphenicol-sensitive protein RarD